MRLDAPDILNASILIVDDQEANVQLLEQLLSDAGYVRVSSTMNPLEVSALHAENRYDLILLDLQMHGGDVARLDGRTDLDVSRAPQRLFEQTDVRLLIVDDEDSRRARFNGLIHAFPLRRPMLRSMQS